MNDPFAKTVARDPEPFRRLHPLSIVLKSLSLLGRNIIAVVVLHFSLFDRNVTHTLIATLGLVTLVVGITALIWSRFTYQVTTRDIRIKSGLLNRNSRSIPFDRIQDVSFKQNMASRLLGLATVALETGAGGGEDGQLEALSRSDAEELRDTIRDYKAGLTIGVSLPAARSVAEDVPTLFAMDNRRILIAGLFNFSFILLAILGALAQNLDFLLPEGFFDPRRWMDALPERETIDGFGSWVRVGGAIAAILSLVAIGFVSGIVTTFVREYGFRLDWIETGQAGFRRRRGLFTLTDMVMPVHRVQAAIVQTGPVRARFGWYHLKFMSLAGDGSGETDHSAAPCAKLAEIDSILARSAVRPASSKLEFRSVNPAFWWRRVVTTWVVLTPIALGLGYIVNDGFFALILLGVPVSVIHFLNWRHHRYALDRCQLYVRSGWWRRKLTILPLRKVQTVDVRQSPPDHPLSLATVSIGIAGGSATAPLRVVDIPYRDAMKLRRCLLGGEKPA